MMRLPLLAIFAALVTVAAGSVVVNIYFKSPGVYTIDASTLAVGGNITVTLNYIPTAISLQSTVSTASYSIYIIGNATFVVRGTMYHNFVPVENVPPNTLIFLQVADAKSTKIKIIVIRNS